MRVHASRRCQHDHPVLAISERSQLQLLVLLGLAPAEAFPFSGIKMKSSSILNENLLLLAAFASESRIGRMSTASSFRPSLI